MVADLFSVSEFRALTSTRPPNLAPRPNCYMRKEFACAANFFPLFVNIVVRVCISTVWGTQTGLTARWASLILLDVADVSEG